MYPHPSYWGRPPRKKFQWMPLFFSALILVGIIIVGLNTGLIKMGPAGQNLISRAEWLTATLEERQAVDTRVIPKEFYTQNPGLLGGRQYGSSERVTDPGKVRTNTAVSVSGTYKVKPWVIWTSGEVVSRFNKVHTVWGYGDGGDHFLGLALDFMVPLDDLQGQQICEYLMNNNHFYSFKYGIWSQRIWNVLVDKTIKPWSQWRSMEDRGSTTENHRDHCHASFFDVAGPGYQTAQAKGDPISITELHAHRPSSVPEEVLFVIEPSESGLRVTYYDG